MSMIKGPDGLDSEDLTAILLGEPAKTAKNRVLSDPGFSQRFKEVYCRARDADVGSEAPLTQHIDAFRYAVYTTGAGAGFDPNSVSSS